MKDSNVLIKYLGEVIVSNKRTINSDVFFYMFKLDNYYNDKNYLLISPSPFRSCYKTNEECELKIDTLAMSKFHIKADKSKDKYFSGYIDTIEFLTEEEVMPLLLGD